jgi:hypothetical protein
VACSFGVVLHACCSLGIGSCALTNCAVAVETISSGMSAVLLVFLLLSACVQIRSQFWLLCVCSCWVRHHNAHCGELACRAPLTVGGREIEREWGERQGYWRQSSWLGLEVMSSCWRVVVGSMGTAVSQARLQALLSHHHLLLLCQMHAATGFSVPLCPL